MAKPAIAVAKGTFSPLRIRIARDCFHEAVWHGFVPPASSPGRILGKEQN